MKLYYPWATLAACTVFMGFTVDSDVAGLEPYRWPTPSDVTVEMVSGSVDVSDGSDLQAVRNAMVSWTALPCSEINLREVGSDADITIDFVSSGWPGAFSGALGVSARIRTGPPPLYTSATIELNDEEFLFSTVSAPFAYDMESVAVHELGHALGLEHSQHPDASMNWAGRRGTNHFRSLHPDDIAGLCYTYPSEARLCTTDADCPLHVRISANAQTRCNSATGSCEAGPAGYGSPCYQDNQCMSDLCVFDPDVVGTPASVPNPGFCSQVCNVDPCPMGSLCADVADLPVGSTTVGTGSVCLLGRDDCVLPADCPASLGGDVLCEPDLDGIFRCVVPCYGDTDCDTQPGHFCRGGTGVEPQGRCFAPGSAGAGDTCSVPSDCASLLCGGGLAPNSCCDGTTCTIRGLPTGTSDGGNMGMDGGPAGDSVPGMGDALSGGDAGLAPGKGGCTAAPPARLAPFLAALALAFFRGRRGLRRSLRKGIG